MEIVSIRGCLWAGGVQPAAGNADKPRMLALSIRQPFAELILRGIKTVELRSRATKIVGERFWIYASKQRGTMWNAEFGTRNGQNQSEIPNPKSAIISADNIVVPTEALPLWMIELAEQIRMIEPDALLPTGVIVGSAVIEKVTQLAGSGQQAAGSPVPELPDAASRELQAMYAWHLSDVKRAKKLRTPKRHPQPVWFKPF